MKIKDLQKEEKPREKLVDRGAENLTDVELLAIILRSGGKGYPATDLARDLLDNFDGLRNLLSSDIEELTKFKNINTAKATSIKALEEISKRYLNSTHDNNKHVRSPKDVFDLLSKDLFNKQQEHLFLISLDSRNKLISKDLISKGTINETLIHPREIFKKALAKNACSIILAHNHPSNKSDPSDEDIKVTRRIFKVGIEIGIPLTDHLVVTNKGFTSMKSQNLLSFS